MKYGAPEEIRTPDPQIRRLTPASENQRLCERNAPKLAMGADMAAPFPQLKSQTEIDAETRSVAQAFCQWLWARPSTPLAVALRQAIADAKG